MDGWIKLHRKLIEKPIWQASTPEQKVILVTLLIMANHKEKEWEWMGEKYKAKPGELVTSLKSITKLCGEGVSIRKVRTALDRFEKYEFLTNQSTNKNRLIKIENWGHYQGVNDKTDKQSDKQLTSNRQAVDKQLTTNKNVKNDKNVKKEDMGLSPLEAAIEDFKDFRKKIKSPMTDRAVMILLTKLDQLADTDDGKIEILNQSIMNGWKSVYEIKDPKTENKKKNTFHNYTDSQEKPSEEELERMLVKNMEKEARK